MKNNFKIVIVALFAASFSFSSCEKDVNEFETINNESVFTEGLEKNPIVIDGKKMEWNLSLSPRKLTKGLILDEADYYSSLAENLRIAYGDDYKLIDTLRFTYNNKKYEYKLLRIDRKSEPGKYFYVMIDNLDVKMDTSCWAYDNNETNVKKYGRLYTWLAANALANKISMKMPVYKANKPTEKYISTKLPVKAKLLSRRDVCDIIECNAIGHLPENGYTINKHNEDQMNSDGSGFLGLFPRYYYDVFLGGLDGPSNDDNDIDYSRGERILGGYRDADIPPYSSVNGDYARLNRQGYIWTREKPANSLPDTKVSHFPLRIEQLDNHNRVYNYSAFINSGAGNKHGYSVRYVFEPLYK